MFKVGDRVKPQKAHSIFSSGVVETVYPEGHFFYPDHIKVKLDKAPPIGYAAGFGPTLVRSEWFEIE